jgi:hypothetical protein
MVVDTQLTNEPAVPDLKQRLRNRINMKREGRVSKNARVTKVKKVKKKVQKMLDAQGNTTVDQATDQPNPFDLVQSGETPTKGTSYAVHPPHEPGSLNVAECTQ